LLKTLQDFIQYFGAERRCSVSRELTKLFEENVRGTLQEVLEHFQQKDVKGEIVIVVSGCE
jgi:Predicted methyltransferases